MITILHNQSLIDIAIQENGTIASVFAWALANNIGITQPLEVGKQLATPTKAEHNEIIAQYFKNKAQNIATGYPNTLFTQPQGIGYMIIENDFIVQ